MIQLTACGVSLIPNLVLLAALQAGPGLQRVYFSALGPSERPVLGLTASEFELRIDGRRAELTGFRGGLHQADQSIPLAAWVLIDFNPGVDARMIENQSGAAEAIFALFHPASAIGVKLVSDRLETLAPLAHDAAALRDAFRRFARNRTELSAVGSGETVRLGRGGLIDGLSYSAGELTEFAARDPSLAGREVRKAVVILSDGNLNPGAKRAPLFATLARERVFLYPVYVPRPQYGSWLADYFELARRSGGVASVFGALAPGSDILRLPRESTGRGALTFNFIHLARDLNGKYSFLAPATARRLSLRCKSKNVRVLLPFEER